MRPDRYQKHERNITASDSGSILERWSYGRDLLNDDKRTTPAGNLRHGALAYLIGRAAQVGCKIGEQEIQRRLKAARTYQTEAEIRAAAHGFATWAELARAGFPAVEMAADAEPADDRNDGDRPAAPGEQLSLFPGEQFGRLSTLAELAKYADEQRQYTDNMAARDQRRAEYLQRLIDAVGGDLSATWEQAEAALA